jgi:hypothetical protein
MRWNVLVLKICFGMLKMLLLCVGISDVKKSFIRCLFLILGLCILIRKRPPHVRSKIP